MKKRLTKKYVLVAVLAISTIFLIIAFVSYHMANGTKSDNDKKELDVEIVEESENISEEIEDEIEEYIEDDISDLDIQEEDEGAVEEDELDGQINEEIAMLPFVQRSKNSNELRIGFMTDLHAKSNSGTSRADRIIKPIFKERINYFIEEMNNEFLPDFLLLNGDVIEGTGRDSEVGSGELESLKKLFNRTLIPKYWVVGNHDLRAVDKNQWKKSLEIDYLDKSFDIGDYRIIILDSNFDSEGNDVSPDVYYTRGKVSSKQYKWIEKELDTNKKKIVFIHHPPLWDVDVRSNSGLLPNSLELQKIFSKNNVTAVFSGHVEDFFYDKIDGVKYFVLPGVIKSEKYQGTFAEIDIIDDSIELNVSYIGSNGKYRKINIKEVL